MITEDYVSFETAKLLKEKGFDGECSRFYMPNGHGRWKHEHYHDFDISDRIECPTLQMAMKWLRKNHNLYITSVPNGIGEDVFYMGIYRKYDCGWTHISDGLDEEHKEAEFSSPEEACEAAIKYCLENLI